MAPTDSNFDLSDWKSTRIPKLAQLDSLQRCLICKDFLKAPVITSCNHTFCSQCIRQHLLSVSRCPLCKSEQFESNLKRVILLEEIVACFQSLRQDLIDLATKEEDAAPNEELPSGKSNAASTTLSPEVIEVLDDAESDAKATPPPGSVQCPICGDCMTADFLQRKHLDECLSGKKKKPAAPTPPKRKRSEISLFFQPRKKAKEVDHEQFYFTQSHKHHHDAKRIPKIDFASVSTPKLKEKLAALKLSVLGTRGQLELRYNQYYLLSNSNLDSSHPVTDLELRQKLNQWEKSHLAFSAAVGANTIFGDSLSHKNVSDKDFPVKAWEQKYREEFRELVVAARKSRKKTVTGKSIPEAETSSEAKNVQPNSDHITANDTLSTSGLPATEESPTHHNEPVVPDSGQETQSSSTEFGQSQFTNAPQSSEPASSPAVKLPKSAGHAPHSPPLEIGNKSILDSQPFDFSSSTLFIPLQQ